MESFAWSECIKSKAQVVCGRTAISNIPVELRHDCDARERHKWSQRTIVCSDISAQINSCSESTVEWWCNAETAAVANSWHSKNRESIRKLSYPRLSSHPMHTVSFHDRAAIKWSTSISDETTPQTIIAAFFSAEEVLRSSCRNSNGAVNSPTQACVALSNIALAIDEFEFNSTSQSPKMQATASSVVKKIRKYGNIRYIRFALCECVCFQFCLMQTDSRHLLTNRSTKYTSSANVTANRSDLRFCYVDYAAL